MERKQILATTSLLVLFVLLLTNCKPKSDSDDETLLLLAVAASKICANSAYTGTTVVNSTATLDTNTDCITGMTSSMSADLPAWIRNNFKCAVGSVSGSNYVFRSQNIPNNKSYYFGSTSPRYEALGSGQKAAGTNQISSQCLVYTIPSSPAAKSGTLTGTQSGYASVGITVNGLAIFNNAAAAPDTLSTEAQTFDQYNGHPQNSGVYHHHSQPLNVSNNNSNLIGVLIDGFALYGRDCTNASNVTTTPTIGSGLDSNHGHITTTQHFSVATYHYHYTSDPTAGIPTLIGSYFYGTPGTVSN
ncbi:YHYH protein [Leptospira sp. 3 VSF25]|uniref:YHYH protein n=1 Tax=Leptospira limi TaxID=2950023 RepID=A0ABT3M0Y4_9LEPT|nr:YHYH protein [Leptospira limi]MCW7463632.1 YHYH protein [Leptospira limi]